TEGRAMPSYLEISSDKLNRLIGTPSAPVIVDVRTDEDFSRDQRLVPGSIRRGYEKVMDWAETIAGPAVVVWQSGRKLSHGVAALLRHAGIPTEVLEGGFEAWTSFGGAAVPNEKLPARDPQGRTVWVTRSRPKIDRIACPWLIKRFVDP